MSKRMTALPPVNETAKRFRTSLEPVFVARLCCQRAAVQAFGTMQVSTHIAQ